jgi:hypothetical protein
VTEAEIERLQQRRAQAAQKQHRRLAARRTYSPAILEVLSARLARLDTARRSEPSGA